MKLFCSEGTAFTRSTWYAYGDTGRITGVAVADDDTMDAPISTSYEWTLAGRSKRVSDPFGTTYGMDILHDDAGRVSAIRETDTGLTPIVHSFAHAPFGPPTAYTTGSVVGGEPLVRELVYYLDHSVAQSRARRGTTTTGGFVYTRDATGRITSRDSLWSGAGAPLDRYYLYDRVGRLNCETTSPEASCPSAGTSLRSTFSYQNGQSQLAPDNRASATFSVFTGTQGSYTYAANSNRLVNVGGYLDFYHDGLGRRTQEDDTTFPGLVGGRQYTYLPNGRLGTITGKTVEILPTGYLLGVDYTVALAYDHEGRVFHIARTSLDETETWEIHYDLFGRLVATRWTAKPSQGGGVVDNHYAYVGGLRVARLEAGAATQRYWSVDDALGTTFEEVSETGASSLRDREAFGTMTASLGAALAFGFPGQFEIPGTKVLRADQCETGCGVPGDPCPTSCALYFLRGGLIQNWHREYDPDTGKYLELDPADEQASAGFALTWNYALSDPLGLADPQGAEPVTGTVLSGLWVTAGPQVGRLVSTAFTVGGASVALTVVGAGAVLCELVGCWPETTLQRVPDAISVDPDLHLPPEVLFPPQSYPDRPFDLDENPVPEECSPDGDKRPPRDRCLDACSAACQSGYPRVLEKFCDTLRGYKKKRCLQEIHYPGRLAVEQCEARCQGMCYALFD